MKTFKILRYCILSVLIAALLAGCGGKKSKDPVQLASDAGEHTAVITFKDFGSISLKLFEKAAPEAVAQFIRLAANGAYNGNTVRNVIDDYCIMIQSEQTDADASEKAFKDEINEDYYPFRGALCLTVPSESISSSQFMIVTSGVEFLKDLEELLAYKKVTPEEYFKTAYGTEIDDDVYGLFLQHGGAPWIYGHSIVFGQVFEGFDVLDSISGIEVESGAAYTPLDEVIIESIKVD